MLRGIHAPSLPPQPTRVRAGGAPRLVHARTAVWTRTSELEATATAAHSSTDGLDGLRPLLMPCRRQSGQHERFLPANEGSGEAGDFS